MASIMFPVLPYHLCNKNKKHILKKQNLCVYLDKGICLVDNQDCLPFKTDANNKNSWRVK